ncbi:hypothetical protein BT96DRAFT_1003900 [Gymnopus androsaceus JB14]|uniref:Uncharacterized protein n=1 Tax=Gymnopus androsaceus JB14 TaxID=1447944 RepID=A0A6A4GUF1_9AGAR|nr:hypothetical protein BT96DRAFT_1003900 [Gymnopus androsaceus JB14]
MKAVFQETIVINPTDASEHCEEGPDMVSQSVLALINNSPAHAKQTPSYRLSSSAVGDLLTLLAGKQLENTPPATAHASSDVAATSAKPASPAHPVAKSTSSSASIDTFFNFTKPSPMTKSTYESENCYDSLHNRDDVRNIVNNSNTHAPEHTWQSDTNLVSKRNAPLEPFSSDLSLSVEFLQQMRNITHACAEAQETSINVAREFSKLMDMLVNTMTPGTPPGIQLHSEVESTSRSRSTSPVVMRPQILPVELSDHHSGIATSIPDISSGIKNREPVATATSRLGLASDTNVHYIRQRPATFDESQVIPMAKWDRIRDPTPIRKLSEVVTLLMS